MLVLSQLPALPTNAAKAVTRFPVLYEGRRYAASLAQAAASGGGGGVSVSDYGGDPTGAIPANQALLDMIADGVPIKWDGLYSLTTQITLPPGTIFTVPDPTTQAVVANNASGRALIFGEGSQIENIRVISTAYPVSALADTAAWSLYNRGVEARDGCRFGYAEFDGLCGGLDILEGTRDVTAGVVVSRNQRSRYGWSAGWHPHGAINCHVGLVIGENSDRLAEIEAGARNCSVGAFWGEGIYPVGYLGQPATYATYSFAGPNAHSHTGEGACRDIRWGDGYLRNCLSSVTVDGSMPDDPDCYPIGFRAGRVEIADPRAGIPVQLAGKNVRIDEIVFSGTPAASISTMLMTHRIYSQDIRIGSLVAQDGSFYGRLANIYAESTRIDHYDVGTQTLVTGGGNPSTRAAILASAHRYSIGPGVFRRPKYHSALFDLGAHRLDNSASPATTPAVGGRRVGMRYVAPTADAPTASRSAAWIAGTRFEQDNEDF